MADPDPNPPAGDPPADPNANPPADPDKFDEARWRNTLETIRKSEGDAIKARKAAETELEKLRKEKQDREDAEKTELEREKSRADAAEKLAADRAAAVKAALTRSEIILESAKLNIVDPDAAEALLPKGVLEYDADDKPTNVAKALADLVKAKPYLVKATGADGKPLPSTPRGDQKVSRDDKVKQTRDELKEKGTYTL